jgi:hypothetical protein
MNQQELEELRLLLEKPIGQNFSKYRDMYVKVLGKPAPSCKCTSTQIWNELNDYYIKNKN